MTSRSKEMRSLANRIYAKIPLWNPSKFVEGQGWTKNTDPKPNLEEIYAMGLLRKENLEHGLYYFGTCRNAVVARWSARTSLFYYIRSKFGTRYEEAIPHPEDQDGYDIFTPIAAVDPNPEETVNEEFTK